MLRRFVLGCLLISLGLLCTSFVWGEQTMILPAEPRYYLYTVSKADLRHAHRVGLPVLEATFGEQAENVLRFNRRDSGCVRVGQRLKVPRLPPDTLYSPMPEYYSPTADSPKTVLVWLDRQFLGLYEYGRLLGSYPISSGRAATPTPVGEYRITGKDADHSSSIYPEPSGGWPMPWAMRFHETEYWLHGGDLPGRPDSHGCVRLVPEDAQTMFGWADIGTPVRIIEDF
jgi:hypothetical protein